MIKPIIFGKYYLLEPINKGGMAEVFKAKEFGVEGFSRLLAIKRILPDVSCDDSFVTMFIDEARLTVQLQHVNITQVYELGKFEDSYYIAMEYIPGKDLRHILDFYLSRHELMPIPEAAFITTGVCEGLDYAHRKCDAQGKSFNIVHRDVSPQNVLINYDGWVKVIDFGIAKAEHRETKTQVGVLKGKFAYMSPEQIAGKPIDHRSDIFAIGIMLYEMVTGRRLFIGDNDMETLRNIIKAKVPSPKKYSPLVSDELEAIIGKALAKEPEERYQWASDLAEDLQPFLIHNNTIFGRKQLSRVLHEFYADDIAVEQAKMKEFAEVRPPEESANEMIANANPNKTCVISAAEYSAYLEHARAQESQNPSHQETVAARPMRDDTPAAGPAAQPGKRQPSAFQEADILKNNLLRDGLPELFIGRSQP